MQHQARFVTLDALRGIAALFVLLFHVGKLYPVWAPGEAYLAVDMFFALSGFVLARTNDARFAAGLGWREFMRRRVIRLYPLYLAGTVFGGIELAIAWHDRGASVLHVLGSLGPNLLLLPAVTMIDKPRMFVVNGAAWSLFCELWVANLLFSLFWKRTSTRNLGLVMVASFAALIALGLHFKMLDMGSVRITAIGGIARVLFSFCTGVLMWRLYKKHGCRYRVPSWALVLILAALLSPNIDRSLWRAVYDLLAVGLVFPAMIYLGAGAYERRPEMGTFAGDVSYALYVTHEPLLFLWNFAFPAAIATTAVWPAIGFVVVAFVVAVVLHYMFDEPARRLLTRLIPAKAAGRV